MKTSADAGQRRRSAQPLSGTLLSVLLGLLIASTTSVLPEAWADEPLNTATEDSAQAQLESLTSTLLADQDLPGVSLAVRLSDGQLLTTTAGYADVETQKAMTPDTRLPGGSTGKSFVAVLTMMLVEDGVLSLDAPVSTWLGERDWFSRLTNGDAITLDMLLSHSSGLRDHVYEWDFAVSAAWRRLSADADDYFEAEELIEFILDEDPLFAPGQGYSYTDSGYLLIGLIIEQATGRDYYDLLNERILEPLALVDTQAAITRQADRLAAGYVAPIYLTVVTGLVGKTMDDDGALNIHPGTEWTGGGLFNTPTMLVKFYSALAEGELLPVARVQQMIDAGYQVPDASHHYGYGTYVLDEESNGRSISHGGWYLGYSTLVVYYLEHHIAIAIQTNTDHDDVDLASALPGILEIALAADSAPADAMALRAIMQDMGQNMQTIAGGISREDWMLVADTAPLIADHPQPPVEERAKIIAFLGTDAPRFVGHDQATHATARTLGEFAASENGQEVISTFAALQRTCLACHQAFRESFQQHFYED